MVESQFRPLPVPRCQVPRTTHGTNNGFLENRGTGVDFLPLDPIIRLGEERKRGNEGDEMANTVGKSLTTRQREALLKIKTVRDLQVKQLEQSIRSMGAEYTHCTPSQWVSVATLTNIHHVSRRDIESLVAKGYLQERPTDGWGLEVFVN
jgi:hypothetical protein